LEDAAEEAGEYRSQRGGDVNREVRGDLCKPLDVSGGREIGEGVGEELELHGDAVKEFCFVLVDLCEDNMLVLEGIFHGRDMAEGDVGALAAQAVGDDVIVEDVGLFEESSELLGNVGIEEGVEVMEEGDRAAVNGVGFRDEGSAAGFSLVWEHA
jgi:hypothetical protein